MPSTYYQPLYHLTFSTKHREPLISSRLAPDLYSYLGGIIRRLDGIALAIGGMPDHAHLLTGLKLVHSVASVLRDLKSGSSEWLHKERQHSGFNWQEGYAAITVSPSAMASVQRYVQNQPHHRKKIFREELIELLKENGIPFDERYLD